jgi:hypothetical protein
VATKPDLRTLKKLLSTLRDVGVTEYEDGSGLKIKLGEQVPAPVLMDAAGDEAGQNLELPDGVMDPVKLLERITQRNRKAAS